MIFERLFVDDDVLHIRVVIEHMPYAGVFEFQIAFLFGLLEQPSPGVERLGAKLLKNYAAAIDAVQGVLDFQGRMKYLASSSETSPLSGSRRLERSAFDLGFLLFELCFGFVRQITRQQLRLQFRQVRPLLCG